jgi:6-pyruvoyl-tetrahydropterin synthase
VYAVEVSDHIMIAHSFRGEVFGPAQRLHGATFAVSVAFMAEALDRDGIVVDIGRAFEVLKQVLAPLNYRNLDDVPEFKTVNTTTEFLTRHVFDSLAAAVKRGELGREPREIDAIRVTVAESPSARAWYEGELWSR